MSAGGGSMESVSIDGRIFPVTADADGARKLGGFSKEVQINGDGSARPVMTRVGWELGGLTLGIDPDRGDQEYLQAIADKRAMVPISATEAGGSPTWQGTGTVTGDIVGSTMNGTCPVTLGGGGKLTQQ